MIKFLDFISQEWMLVSGLCVLVYLFAMNEMKRGGRYINHHDLTRLVNEDKGVVVDIRDSNEVSDGVIVGSILINHAKLDGENPELIESKDKTIILVDKMGQHAGSVGPRLTKKGFDVVRLKGGIAEWKSANLPLVKA